MNLHEVVSSAINAINPFQDITIVSKGGFFTNEYGEREAIDNGSITVKADIQPISSEDIKFINNYNQSSIYKSFYVSADVHGVNRPMAKSGDIIKWNGQTYYVTSLKEGWYETCGWNHFVGVLQTEGENGYT